ncbi:MAG TPA: sterol desaturase family protein [Caulobacteraceae bacterium]
MAPGVIPLLTLAVMVAMLVAERVWPAAPPGGEWGNNLVAYGLTISGQVLKGALPAVLTTEVVNGLGGGFVDLGKWPLWAGALTWLVAMDLGEYLFHRAQHAFPWMWAMHSLHHSDRALNFSTTQRHFWLEPALKAVSIWLAVAILFKTDAAIIAVYVLVSLYHYVIHANLRLGFGSFSWLLNSPRYHRLHHSREARHHNANFASLLPIFDVLTGAYRRPGPGEFPESGLDEAVNSPWQLIVWPLRGARRWFVRGQAASS